MEVDDKSPLVGLSNDGQLVIKNRAYRRRWKNTAELEGRKSKHYYTKKRSKNGRKSKKSKKAH